METSSFICEYCGSALRRNSSLEFHKKNSKKCLKKQAEILPLAVIQSNLVTCTKCDRKYTNRNMKMHLLSCKGNNETIAALRTKLDEKEKENIALTQAAEIADNEHATRIRKLKTALALKRNMLRKMVDINREQKRIIVDLRKRAPSKLSKIETYLQNSPYCLDFADREATRKVFELSTYNDWSDLVKLSEFVAKNLLLKNNVSLYVASDPSRANFYYKNANGEICYDLFAGMLHFHLCRCQLLPIVMRIITEHDAENPGDTRWHQVSMRAHETYKQLIVNYDKCSAFFRNIARITFAHIQQAALETSPDIL